MEVSTTTQPRVVLLGDYYVDLVFADLPRWPAPGEEVFAAHTITLAGGAYNHARALHRLGVPVTWTAELGNDSYSATILQAATGDGLDQSGFVRHDRPLRNVSVAASHDGERGFISFREPVPRSDPSDLIRDLRPDLVLLVEMPALAYLDRVAAAAHEVGAGILLDPQHTDLTTANPTLRHILEQVDVFLPNAAEARQVTGQGSLNAALEDLLHLTGTVVIKDGPHGAVAADRTESVRASAPAVTAVDTIGAGDCFDAGLVAALAWGQPLEAALRLGVLCGSLSTQTYGGVGAPTLESVRLHSPDLVPWASTHSTSSEAGR
jgi:sugar/nucleoside kinase (ribokinase family)